MPAGGQRLPVQPVAPLGQHVDGLAHAQGQLGVLDQDVRVEQDAVGQHRQGRDELKNIFFMNLKPLKVKPFFAHGSREGLLHIQPCVVSGVVVVPLHLLDVLLPGQAVPVGPVPHRVGGPDDAGAVGGQGGIAAKDLQIRNPVISDDKAQDLPVT